MKTGITIPEKILYLRRIKIFESLSVGELAAVAAATGEVEVQKGEMIIKEGNTDAILYLILTGKVTVIKSLSEENGQEVELASMRSGNYFGEMALFEDAPRAATVRALERAHFLTLDKNEFTEILTEYPKIALHICNAFCKRMRELHLKINSCELDRSMLIG